jgi:uncharacterized protein YegP (UPF0339 family)
VRFHIWQDKAGGWRWRLLAANGRLVGESGEAYSRRRDCERAVLRVCEGVARVQGLYVTREIEPWAVIPYAPLGAGPDYDAAPTTETGETPMADA